MSRVLITPALLFYSPVGLILVIIRSLLLIYVFLASVILYTVPPIKRLLLRSMCSLLGFIVTSEGRPCCSREQPIVSNCTTLFDHMALNLLTNCVTPYKFMLSWALTWRYLNYDELDYKSKICDVFHLQPEETPTGINEKIILKFNPAPFRLFNKVQPVAISVRRYLPINLSVHPIDWKYEIFWVLFSPIIRVHVKFLPPISKPVDQNDQNIEDFMEIVREEIARNLDAKLSSMDKNQFWLLSGERSPTMEITNTNTKYEKCDNNESKDADETAAEANIHSEITNSNVTESCTTDPRIGQVMAVLPDVNENQVRTLLERMQDVDTVIAHLLEQSDTLRVNSLSRSTVTHISPSCHKIAASSFSRNPEERHKSFADRKAAFVENARQRYLEIHQN